MVSSVLVAVWGFAWSEWKSSTLEKAKSSCTIFVCCTHKNSQLFKNVLYCYYSVSQNECINWIHHFRCADIWRSVFLLNTISTFFKQCSLFVNFFFDWNILFYTHHTFFCKYHMVWTSQLLKISWQTSVQTWSTLMCSQMTIKMLIRILHSFQNRSINIIDYFLVIIYFTDQQWKIIRYIWIV